MTITTLALFQRQVTEANKMENYVLPFSPIPVYGYRLVAGDDAHEVMEVLKKASIDHPEKYIVALIDGKRVATLPSPKHRGFAMPVLYHRGRNITSWWKGAVSVQGHSQYQDWPELGRNIVSLPHRTNIDIPCQGEWSRSGIWVYT